MLLKDGEREVVVRVADKGHLPGLGRARLARELFSGRFRPGQSLQIDRIAVEHGMDKESVLKTLAEFQALGMITLANDFSASVNPPDPKPVGGELLNFAAIGVSHKPLQCFCIDNN